MKTMILLIAAALLIGGCASNNQTFTKNFVIDLFESVDSADTFNKTPELAYCFGMSKEEASASFKPMLKSAIEERAKSMPDILDQETFIAYGNEMDYLSIKKYIVTNKDKFMPDNLKYIEKKKCEALYEKIKPVLLAAKPE